MRASILIVLATLMAAACASVGAPVFAAEWMAGQDELRKCPQDHPGRQHRGESLIKAGDSTMASKAAKHSVRYAIVRYDIQGLVAEADMERADKQTYEFLKWKLGNPSAIAAQWLSAGYQHFDRGYSDEAAAALVGFELPHEKDGLAMFQLPPELVDLWMKLDKLRNAAGAAILEEEYGIPKALSKPILDELTKQKGALAKHIGFNLPKDYDFPNVLLERAIEAKRFPAKARERFDRAFEAAQRVGDLGTGGAKPSLPGAGKKGGPGGPVHADPVNELRATLERLAAELDALAAKLGASAEPVNEHRAAILAQAQSLRDLVARIGASADPVNELHLPDVNWPDVNWAVPCCDLVGFAADVAALRSLPQIASTLNLGGKTGLVMLRNRESGELTFASVDKPLEASALALGLEASVNVAGGYVEVASPALQGSAAADTKFSFAIQSRTGGPVVKLTLPSNLRLPGGKKPSVFSGAPCCEVVALLANGAVLSDLTVMAAKVSDKTTWGDPCCGVAILRNKDTGELSLLSVKDPAATLALRVGQIAQVLLDKGVAYIRDALADKTGGNVISASITSSSGPLPTSESRANSQAPFTILDNLSLKGRAGRLVISYPAGANCSETWYRVFTTGDTPQEVTYSKGPAAIDLPPGKYFVQVGGKYAGMLAEDGKYVGVPVEVRSRCDTNLGIGVLRLTLAADTWFKLIDPRGQGEKDDVECMHSKGACDVGLPVGSLIVALGGAKDPIEIKNGEILEY